MSPFDPSGLGAEEILGLSGERLKVAAHFQPRGFSSPKAKPGRSEWLAVDGLVGASDNRREGASSGTDWWWRNGSEGVGRGCPAGVHYPETTPDALLATLDDTCDVFEPPLQDPPPTVNLPGPSPGRVTST